tara:strand:- start:190 stop:438 length:249 start_codon:yes stop_codon:yes gene_type:complete
MAYNNNPFIDGDELGIGDYVPWERGKQIRCRRCKGLLSSEFVHVNLSECTTDFFESNVTQTHTDDPTGWESDCEDVPWGDKY